jgi:hypothetical protein
LNLLSHQVVGVQRHYILVVQVKVKMSLSDMQWLDAPWHNNGPQVPWVKVGVLV